MAKASGSSRLDRFGDFAMIDNLVQNYSGAYTHDDIFDMDVVMVHNMILYAKECAYVQSATTINTRAANKAKK